MAKSKNSFEYISSKILGGCHFNFTNTNEALSFISYILLNCCQKSPTLTSWETNGDGINNIIASPFASILFVAKNGLVQGTTLVSFLGGTVTFTVAPQAGDSIVVYGV